MSHFFPISPHTSHFGRIPLPKPPFEQLYEDAMNRITHEPLVGCFVNDPRITRLMGLDDGFDLYAYLTEVGQYVHAPENRPRWNNPIGDSGKYGISFAHERPSTGEGLVITHRGQGYPIGLEDWRDTDEWVTVYDTQRRLITTYQASLQRPSFSILIQRVSPTIQTYANACTIADLWLHFGKGEIVVSASRTPTLNSSDTGNGWMDPDVESSAWIKIGMPLPNLDQL